MNGSDGHDRLSYANMAKQRLILIVNDPKSTTREVLQASGLLAKFGPKKTYRGKKKNKMEIKQSIPELTDLISKVEQ